MAAPHHPHGRLELPPSVLMGLWAVSSFLIARRMALRGLRKGSLSNSGEAGATGGCGILRPYPVTE